MQRDRMQFDPARFEALDQRRREMQPGRGAATEPSSCANMVW